MRFKTVAVFVFTLVSMTITHSAKAVVVIDNPFTFELTITTSQVLTDPTVVLFDASIPTQRFDLGEFAPPGTYTATFDGDLGSSTTYSFLSLYGENLSPNTAVAAAFASPIAAKCHRPIVLGGVSKPHFFGNRRWQCLIGSECNHCFGFLQPKSPSEFGVTRNFTQPCRVHQRTKHRVSGC